MKKMGGVAALMDKLPAQMGQAAAGMADDNRSIVSRVLSTR